MIRVFLLVAGLFAWPAVAGEGVRLAVTTSFHNSGLADVLLPEFRADTGVEVQLLVVGTGQAIRLGEAGDVDAILVHSRAAEEAFVASGNGTHRREIMYNDFIVVGPSADPAGAGAAENAAAALAAIHRASAVFVSRGDDSGTHKKELMLWTAAGLNPDEFEAWYRQVGAGMGAALNTASAMGAYLLADRASWLNFGNSKGLELIFEGDDALFNQYAYLPVNPARHPHVNAEATAQLESWLTSERAAALIDSFQIDGQSLFVFNASVSE